MRTHRRVDKTHNWTTLLSRRGHLDCRDAACSRRCDTEPVKFISALSLREENPKFLTRRWIGSMLIVFPILTIASVVEAARQGAAGDWWACLTYLAISIYFAASLVVSVIEWRELPRRP